MQKADASRMGQKKHHQSSLRTTTLVTTRSRAAKLAARPDKTHGSIESEKRLLPRTQPRPVAEDEIFALPFLHAPTRDHSVYNLSRDEDTHGVPPHRPSASEWATCYGLSKSSTEHKNGIRRSKMLPQAPPQCRTFTKNIQQIHCLLGRCSCSGHAPVR